MRTYKRGPWRMLRFSLTLKARPSRRLSLPKAALSVSSLPNAVSRRQVLLAAPAVVSAVACAGCGYSLAGRGSFLPSYIRIIGIPLFQNRTPFVTVEQLFTERVRVEFQSRGHYSVQPTEEGADGVV